MSDDVFAGQKSEELLEYLLKRRSVSIKSLDGPGPNKEQIETILTAASRTPDHGKLFPWYFLVFEGNARISAGEKIAELWQEEEPGAPPAKIELELNRFLRAPLVIGVISRIRKGKHPVWEQILSSGAVCQNLCLAANALGFGTNWLTEWYAYNQGFCEFLGLDEQDHIAGFIHIGTPSEKPIERTRPDLGEILTYWEQGATLNKGASYGIEEMGFPRQGFEFKDKK